MTKTIEVEIKKPNSGPLVEELFVQYSKMREYAAELENKLEQKDVQFQKLLEQNVNWSQECNNINQINAQLTEESKKLKVHCKNLEEENSFLRDKHTTFDSNGNSVEPIILKQTLPVVSEDVAKIIKKYNVYDLINYNLEDDECEILDEFVYKHIKTEYEKYEYIAQLAAVGYTVEKAGSYEQIPVLVEDE